MKHPVEHYQQVFPLRDLSLTGVLWIVVIVAMIGDVVTTFTGLRLGLAESNPVALYAINTAGPLGLIALKLVAVLVSVWVHGWIDQEYQAAVPDGLALPSAVAVIINVYMIFMVIQ